MYYAHPSKVRFLNGQSSILLTSFLSPSMKWEAICYCFTWSAIADIAHPNTSLTRYTPCEFGLVTAKFCGVLATSGPAVCGWGQVSTALNCESGIAPSNDGFAITFAWKDILGSCGTFAVFILLTRKCSEPFKWLTLKRKSRQDDCPGGHWIPWKQLQCNQWRPWQSPWRLFRLWYTCNSNESYNSLLASLLFIGAGQPLWCRSCRRWLHWNLLINFSATCVWRLWHSFLGRTASVLAPVLTLLS